MPTRALRPVGFSRHLTLPSALAPGIALGSAVALASAAPVAGASQIDVPLVYGLAAPLFLPWVWALSKLPEAESPYQLVRRGGPAGPAFAAGWVTLASMAALAGLLAKTAAAWTASAVTGLSGLEMEPWRLLPLILGPVLVNSLLGTRGAARGALVFGALALAALVGLLIQPWVLGEVATQAPDAAAGRGGHRLMPLALLAAGLWAVELVTARRRLLRRRRTRTQTGVSWIVLALWIGCCGFGILAWWALPEASSAVGGRRELALAVLVALVCVLGLTRVFAAAARSTLVLGHEGLLPRAVVGLRSEAGVPVVPLVALAGLGGWVTLAPNLDLVAVASFGILSTSALALGIHLRRRKERQPVPPGSAVTAVALGISVFLLVILPPKALGVSAAWLGLGAAYYLAWGRRGHRQMERSQSLVGDAEDVEDPPFRVLVATGGEPLATSCIRLGAAVAEDRGGELLVLRVAPWLEEVPRRAMRARAEVLWRDLDRRLGPLGVSPRPIPLVRIAPTPAQGILEASAELGVDLLVLGWAGEAAAEEPVVERVFPATSLPVALVRGGLPEKIRRVVVANGGGPHAGTAFELGSALARDGAEEIVSTFVDTPRIDPEQRRRADEIRGEAFAAWREQAGDRPMERKVQTAATVAEGLGREAGIQDVLVVGATLDRLLGQTIFGGLAAKLATERPGATILVKRGEPVRRFLSRRLWQWLSNPLPVLPDDERTKIQLAMRRAARAEVDFYLLITLASIIASLGLMQSSAAVIIGAMLVAPLMSPILAMGHAIARGHLRSARRGAVSTIRGVAVAVAAGAACALVTPSARPTAEMLARGAPGLLDLGVALASGAAAAYASSRSSLSAALPGVAIAAALVPPLCVVGYGLGASELGLAGGALLLFVTNLFAIVLASTTMFLALGFRPSRAVRHPWVWRAVRLAMLVVLLLTIPLTLSTRDALRQGRLEDRVEASLRLLEGDGWRLQALDVRAGAEVEVEATVLVADGADPRDLEGIRRGLEQETGRPVRLRVQSLRATFAEVGPERGGVTGPR
ncbi:MAG: DUF389 domain-containing protein [Acidobacteriota bacterium]